MGAAMSTGWLASIGAVVPALASIGCNCCWELRTGSLRMVA